MKSKKPLWMSDIVSIPQGVDPGCPGGQIQDCNCPPGKKGDAATIEVLPPNIMGYGYQTNVQNLGTSSDAKLLFTLIQPQTLNVGTVTTLSYGTPAYITNVGDEQNQILDFGIPQGKPAKQIKTVETTSTELYTGDYVNTITYDDLSTDTFKSPKGPKGDNATYNANMLGIVDANSWTNGNKLMYDTASLKSINEGCCTVTNTIISFTNVGTYRLRLDLNVNSNHECFTYNLGIILNNIVIGNFKTPTKINSISKITGELIFTVTNSNSNLWILNNSGNTINVNKNVNNTYPIVIERIN